MRRFFVTGTDTDVGKTVVTASLASALHRAGQPVTVVKLVQTGLASEEEGDAQRAGRLAGVPCREFVRLARPADPWSAAVAQRAPETTAGELCARLAELAGALVAEGAGGICVPLNAREEIGEVALAAGLEIVLAIGLRLGCINHARLTVAYCEQRSARVAGGVLVERWGPTTPEYRHDVLRALQGKLRIVGIVPFAPDEAGAVAAGSALFDALLKE